MTSSPRAPHRPARIRALVCAVLSLAVLLAAAAGASAAPGSANPHGKFLGVVGHHLAGAAAPNIAGSYGNLSYHGGQVMHSDANYAIFWEPPGTSTTSSYKSVIQNYFGGVAADSGSGTNVYSTDTQYYDSLNGVRAPIAYNASYGGAIVDTQPYPANGCAPRNGAPCLTDAQVSAELDRVVSANHLPRGLGAVYYVFFPANVGSCFDSTGSTCSFSDYCAYHSSFDNGTGSVLYANMPYAAIPGCDPGQRPNGDPADATLNVLSHENNETITDPLGTAWYDQQGNENGDKCNFTFGSPLGGPSGAQFNQLIAGGDYWLQEEWSNIDRACRQRSGAAPQPDERPTASFSQGAATAGSPVSFNGTASSDPDGSISSYSWNFGDGATATGANPSHTYAQAGSYLVTLTVGDSAGLSASTSQSITVNAAGPPPPPPVDESPTAAFTFSAYPNSTYVRFAASGADPDGSITSYAWTFGDGTTATKSSGIHRFPRAGSYTVTITVTDSAGLTASATHVVTVS
ncbi:MAG: PKD domain-containing protein [Solirubrobacteraceae bacterium]